MITAFSSKWYIDAATVQRWWNRRIDCHRTPVAYPISTLLLVRVILSRQYGGATTMKPRDRIINSVWIRAELLKRVLNVEFRVFRCVVFCKDARARASKRAWSSVRRSRQTAGFSPHSGTLAVSLLFSSLRPSPTLYRNNARSACLPTPPSRLTFPPPALVLRSFISISRVHSRRRTCIVTRAHAYILM